MKLNTNTYETLMQVRPDDIDMFRHVHSSRYTDYVLAARYQQMKQHYGMGMEDFLAIGLGWVIATSHIEFKRPLLMGENFIVRTRLAEFEKHTAKVEFEIVKAENKKACATGFFNYTMIDIETGRSKQLPQWIIDKYSLPD